MQPPISRSAFQLPVHHWQLKASEFARGDIAAIASRTGVAVADWSESAPTVGTIPPVSMVTGTVSGPQRSVASALRAIEELGRPRPSFDVTAFEARAAAGG